MEKGNITQRAYDLVGHMKIKELKQACIVRGINFRDVSELDVWGLQDFLIKNWAKVSDKTLLNEYDIWLENELKSEGLTELIHPLLRMGYFGEDEEGNEVRRQVKNIAISNVKSKKEIAMYKPKKGSKKSLVYFLIRENPKITTNELIDRLLEEYPDISIGSIKSWASRARKAVKYGNELNL